MTSQSKREVRAEERFATVAGIDTKKKRDDDEGGHCRSECTLMEATMTAHEIFADTRADHWPNHLSDVLQAEMWMLQNMDFKTDFGDVLKWSDFICSPHIMKVEGSRSRAY